MNRSGQYSYFSPTQFFLKGLQIVKYLSTATATTLYTLPETQSLSGLPFGHLNRL